MNIKNSIQGSFFFGLLMKLGYLASNSRIFNISLKQESKLKGNVKGTWMDSSAFYQSIKVLDRFFGRLEALIYKGISESILFSWAVSDHRERAQFNNEMYSSSLLVNSIGRLIGTYTFTDFLALSIGFYVVIDYVVRRLPVISALGSVWDELLLLFVVFYIVL